MSCLEWTDAPGAVVIALAGEIDLVSAENIAQYVDAALAAGRRRITFDLAGVEFMDSQGLNAICRAHHRATSAGGEVRLRAPTRVVAKVLAVTGIDEVIPVDR